MDAEIEKERHPFRFMFKLAVFAGILVAAGRYLMSKKEEYSGLSESEARAKMESKLSPRLGEEKASEIADQVIPVLMDKGVIKTNIDKVADKAKDVAEAASDKAKDMTEAASDKAKDVADSVTDKARDVAAGAAGKVEDAAKSVKNKVKS